MVSLDTLSRLCHMASLKRIFLERLRWLIRWFFPQTASSQTASSQTASSQTASSQTASSQTASSHSVYHQLVKPLLDDDNGIEMTHTDFDELPFFPFDDDNSSIVASNPSSLETKCDMVIRGVPCF